MRIYSFERALLKPLPPDEWPDSLVAMWWDAKGNWGLAHENAEKDDTPEGAWVHAYLHRKEGDIRNATYWYRAAGKPVADGSFEVERNRIVNALIAKANSESESLY